MSGEWVESGVHCSRRIHPPRRDRSNGSPFSVLNDIPYIGYVIKCGGMNDRDPLSPAEEAVLAVYKIRRIRPGYGLTATTFRKELMYLPLPGISEAIASLLGKGYLNPHPVIQDFYLLTRKGDDHRG